MKLPISKKRARKRMRSEKENIHILVKMLKYVRPKLFEHQKKQPLARYAFS